jgi:transcriptional regulator with XRE-family HTH domain
MIPAFAHLLPPSGRREGITPTQCQAARRLLGITAADLSKTSGVSLAAIKNFERSRCIPNVRTVRDIRGALEAGGVVFGSSINDSGLTVSVSITQPIQFD